MNRWKRCATVAALLAILCACGQGKDSPKGAAGKQLDPAQSACIESVMKRHSAQDANFAARHIEALKAQRSSVDITLEQRRANEQLCLEYAQCFTVRDNTLNGIVVGTMFSSCLKDVEREL
jgi:hypothetical protein